MRSAISRAYYAAFCHVRNYARDQHGFSPGYTADDHQQVRDHYRTRGQNDVARRLNQLRQWRNTCDYTDTVYNLPFISARAIAEAQQIFDTLI